MRLIQALQAISQSIISPNTCSLFLHVHDKSFCLSRSLLLIHPSLTFCSLTHVPHAGSGLRGLSVRLLADALCRAAGFWPICPFQLFTPSTVRKQCTPDATAVTTEPSEPKWLPRLRALGGSWFRKWSKTRLLYANSKPTDAQNGSNPMEKVVLSSFGCGSCDNFGRYYDYKSCSLRCETQKVHIFVSAFWNATMTYDDRIAWRLFSNVVLAPDG